MVSTILKDTMFIDSHCHLDLPELIEDLPNLLEEMKQNLVTHALSISVDVSNWAQIKRIIETYPHIYGSVGTHPDYENVHEPIVEELIAMLKHPKVIATGETGLDYYRLQGDLTWQRNRFRNHIQAALISKKPLVVHTRNAQEDTITILKEEKAKDIGGVMHCFTENIDMARLSLDQNFYISFSGIISFKNAKIVHETAAYVPIDRILIETDSPYLAPTPHRGKANQPAWVRYVAEHIAKIKGMSIEEVGFITSENFKRCFNLSHLN